MKSLSLTMLAVSLTAIYLPLRAQNYTLHEWGTFTTVAGSDGTHLDGVEREEAPLPAFVHQLDELQSIEHPNGMKGFHYSRPLAHVNVRMETPVIYFYTNEAFNAQVDVRFRGGAISQWFPDRSAGEKLAPIQRNKEGFPLAAENVIDFGRIREGAIRWNVRVEPAGEDQSGRVFQGGESPCWLHPRLTDSALVTNSREQTEKYLFYRGLGHLKLPVTFSATDQELRAMNCGRDAVGYWLVFDLNAQRQARWVLPSPISQAPAAGNGAAVTVPLQSQQYRADWKKPLYSDAVKLLVSAGLYRKEADAMLQTWWNSYFERPGLRVFWIVPRGYVDEVLPLTVSPAPKVVERVIVGRTEILTPAFEQRLLAGFVGATDKVPNPWTSDRFFPAYNERVSQLKKVAAADVPPPSGLPVGKWNVHFANGASEVCEIREDGSATVSEASRRATGKAVVNNGFVEIRFDDHRAERWTVAGGWMAVHHWFPDFGMPASPPVSGVAQRIKESADAAARVSLNVTGQN